MKAEGLVPDIVSYRTLLYAFSLRKMVGEAEALIVEMGERGLEIDEYTVFDSDVHKRLDARGFLVMV